MELAKNGTWIYHDIPRIGCKKSFADNLRNKNWVESNGTRYSSCFDLSHGEAKIGGAEDGELG